MLKKILLTFLALYVLIGFVVIPLILKSQIMQQVQANTNSQIEIETIYFNPFNARLEIVGLRLSSLDEKELVKIKSIVTNIELISLFKPAFHLSNFTLEEPEINLVLDKEKKINFSSIVKESEEKQEGNSTTEIPRIILDNIAIVNGSLNYEDYSRKTKFAFAVDRIGFQLKDIDTKNLQTSDASLRLYMSLEDGGFLDLKSEIVSLEPFAVKGTLEYEASKLYSKWRYIQDSVNLEVADGKVFLSTKYFFDLGNLESSVISDLNFSLDGLRVKPKGDYKDILTLRHVGVENVTVKPFLQDIHVERLELDSLYAKALRDKKKKVDWLEYTKFTPSDSPVEEKKIAKEENSKEWSLVVDDVAIEKIKLDFIDKGVSPSVTSKLNEFNLYAQDITLSGEKPLSYQTNLLLNNTFKCDSKGSVIHKNLNLQTKTACSGLDVTHYLPYIDEVARAELKTYNVKLDSLKTEFNADVDVKESNSTLEVDMSDANIKLSDFILSKRTTKERLVSFRDLKLNGIALNTASKELNVENSVLRFPHIRTKRLEDGSLNIGNLIVPHTKKEEKKAKKVTNKPKAKEFRVHLKKVSLKGAKASFEDKQMNPRVNARIDQIYFDANNIDSKEYTWSTYYATARVNNSGKLRSQGSLRHTPLKQKGKTSLEKLSLKEITPYLQESAYVTLDDGSVSFKAKTKYSPSKKRADLSVDGSFKLEDIFISDSRDQSSLLSFNKLDLREFTLETEPNRFFVNEMDIDSFFINAMVDANKTMNLATLVKGSDSNVSQSNDQNQSEQATEIVEVQKDPFPARIMKLNVTNGSAKFSDLSLPLDFRTNIHSLNGVIYAISSSPDETSYIDIAGDIDKYGSTKLKGSVNASDPKAFTDLDFNFRNLDLSAMSGYSRSFAGYHIDDGKLFLNLNYDIENSQLKGENSIIVKKIKLGEEVDIEGGSLPLGFVIALLEDDEGVIDIDMPIRGNVDEPEFKYGALIWKTFGNLILKAVASPFKFLGSVLGIGGEELEYAEFEAGSLAIIASEREKLDNVAKFLVKRPKILLNINGAYDAVLDKKALQKEKLISLVVKKSGAKNEEERISAMTVDLLEDIYEDVKDDNAHEKLEKKLKKEYKGEALERVYLQELVKLCSSVQIVSDEELKTLAAKRATVLKSYLINDKGIDATRVKESEVLSVQSDESEFIRSKLEVIVK